MPLPIFKGLIHTAAGYVQIAAAEVFPLAVQSPQATFGAHPQDALPVFIKTVDSLVPRLARVANKGIGVAVVTAKTELA